MKPTLDLKFYSIYQKYITSGKLLGVHLYTYIFTILIQVNAVSYNKMKYITRNYIKVSKEKCKVSEQQKYV